MNRKLYQNCATGDVYNLPYPKIFPPNFFTKIEIPTKLRKIMKIHQISLNLGKKVEMNSKNQSRTLNLPIFRLGT